jgi:hypothetical protein
MAFFVAVNLNIDCKISLLRIKLFITTDIKLSKQETIPKLLETM